MLNVLEESLKTNLQEEQVLDKDFVNNHKKKLKLYVKHLTKEHNLVRSGYYTETYMALGLSLGVAFGLVILDNLAIGLAIGLALGVGIGSGRDADAKKKGLVI